MVIIMTNSEEYVNMAEALKRIGGSVDLYKRLLSSFKGGDHIGPLEDALGTGNLEEAAHLVHTLKGTGANLSLIKLTKASAEFEQTLKSGADYAKSFEDLKQTFDTTLQFIEEILEQ
jgi:HPt (histidine-containing phosphotransfer) domain-containing protein